MRHFIYAIMSVAVFIISGCDLTGAANDLADDLDNLTKTEGPQACYDIMDDVYGDLDAMEGCSDTPVIGEGETSESLGQAWCDDNCSDLSSKVEHLDVSSCANALYTLECEDRKAFIAGTFLPDNCSWMSSDLGC